MLIPYESDYIDTDILDKQLTGAEKCYVEYLKQKIETQAQLIEYLRKRDKAKGTK